MLFISRVGWRAFRGTRAPVGHLATHSPQDSQIESTIGLSPKVLTLAELPRKAISMTPTAAISWQARTHLPQRIHLLWSRLKAGWLLSIGTPCLVLRIRLKWSWSTPT